MCISPFGGRLYDLTWTFLLPWRGQWICQILVRSSFYMCDDVLLHTDTPHSSFSLNAVRSRSFIYQSEIQHRAQSKIISAQYFIPRGDASSVFFLHESQEVFAIQPKMFVQANIGSLRRATFTSHAISRQNNKSFRMYKSRQTSLFKGSHADLEFVTPVSSLCSDGCCATVG
jgi:hypothetical protein